MHPLIKDFSANADLFEAPQITKDKLFERPAHHAIELVDGNHLDSFHWPETIDGNYAQRFLEPYLKNGIHSYVDNVNADFFVLKIKNFVFPVIVVTENYDNSYVCSPYAHYISLGKEHIDLVTNPFLRHPIKWLLNGLGRFVKSGRINSVVYVNNWLFSVDLYPKGLEREDISEIKNFLAARFPEHAIMFRSLNGMTNVPLIDALKNEGFHLIPSRYVLLTNATDESIFKTRILKSDLKFLRESPFELIDESQISSDEYPQLLNFYRLFYITQHSPLNPQFNLRFMKLMIEQGLMRFKILKVNGAIKGVAGYFERGGIMYCPMLGYDKNDPDHKLIYRHLSTDLLLEARKNQWIFHQSAGASFYKSIRRAQGYMEYMGVYTAHLPFKQKTAWTLLGTLINSSSRFMKNY